MSGHDGLKSRSSPEAGKLDTCCQYRSESQRAQGEARRCADRGALPRRYVEALQEPGDGERRLSLAEMHADASPAAETERKITRRVRPALEKTFWDELLAFVQISASR